MKKILFLQSQLVLGGAEAVLVNYLNIFAKNPEYKVDLAVMESAEKHYLDKIDAKVSIDFILNDIETQFGRYTYWELKKDTLMDSQRRYYKSWNDHINNVTRQRVFNKIETEKYDVIIDNSNVFIYFLNRDNFIKKIKTPIVHWIHSNGCLTEWASNKEKFYSTLSNCHSYISICKDMKKQCDSLLSEFGLVNKNSIFIYNPIDIQRITSLMEQPIDDKDNELFNDEFILQVGRLANGKNHSEMINIYAELKQRGIKEKLYIIGDGPSYQDLQNKINSLNLQNDCFLLGSRTNPFPFMKKAKLFIHTSNFEGLGMVLVESMICGTPVVSYDCPVGPREVLADGKYGELIPLHNKDMFIEKTLELLNNETKRQHFINLLPEAVERFSMDNISKQVFEVIDNIIDSSNRLE